MDHFYKVFKQEETDILGIINSIQNEDSTPAEKQVAVERSLAGISQLSEKVRNVASTLPNHDQQTYTKAISLLKQNLEDVRATSAPPKKFTFKKFNRQIPVAKSSTTEVQDQGSLSKDVDHGDSTISIRQKALQFQPPPSPAKVAQTSSGFTLSSLKSTHYVLKPSTIEDASIASLENIQGSIIDISMPPSAEISFATLMAKNIQETLLNCGVIAGSAHITGLKDCSIIITARQIRMHSCHDIIIYLQCSSRPIIEDCRGIRFARLPQNFVRDDTKRQSNLWDQVDDFKWLRPDPSPNWSILKPDDSRAIEEEILEKILEPESPSLELKERLQLAKLV